MRSQPLLRSVLYVPASNSRAIEKARGLDCDAVILDLEDAVAPDAKETARANAILAADTGGFGDRQVIIRVNGLDTPWGEDDLRAVARSKADGVLVPKIRDASDLSAVQYALSDAEDALALWAMIETCQAVIALREIIGAQDPRLACFVLGTNDLLKEMRGLQMPDRANLIGMLSATVAAARAGGLSVVDGVFNAIDDAAGFTAECRQGRAIGFDGKTLIHPSQIQPCHNIFSPSDAVVIEARAICDAFASPENVAAGVIRLNGKMVERLHLEIAQDVLAQAARIQARASATVSPRSVE
ncbi:CoA ester lyase [Sphingobium sp. 3R8]|uniref:HpcH/HpaI aldolase/citrate lyase family protein n=1 Tax=Sphingobium sp. 3R8 TaxID=2874921 RepID=UPI001CC9659F|nr:CoA ester lyase [Sphingobium sp. 3R8]MBZ9646897.1 CoA ester lyase [Sphingobium sp. 3R8]